MIFMKMRKRLAAHLAFLAFLLGTGASLAARTGAVVDIQILQTTDIHGHFVPSEAAQSRGGWLQLAPVLRAALATHGRERTLLIDCGDTFQGSFLEARERGAASLAMLDFLGYDVWVPGNHAFDFGLSRFAELAAGQRPRLLCGNFSCQDAAGTPMSFPAWRLFETAGARIAVIGATHPGLPQWFWGTGWPESRVETVTAMLRRIMPEVLGAKPHLIVLAVHAGWGPDAATTRGGNEVAEIATLFPEIDLILGGHTHREFAGQRIGARSWYVQAGFHANAAARIMATIDTGSGKLLNLSSSLLPADPAAPLPRDALPPGPRDALKAAELAGSEKIGELAAAAGAAGIPGRDCATSEIICRAIAAATGAGAVVHGRLSTAGLPAGAITEQDLFSVVPYENNIAIAMLTENEITDIMQEQLDNRSSYVACGPWGFRVKLNSAGDFVAGVTLADGGAWTGRRAVAFNSYTVAGGGGRFPVLRAVLRTPEACLRDTGIGTRAAVRQWLSGPGRGMTVQAVNWLVEPR